MKKFFIYSVLFASVFMPNFIKRLIYTTFFGWEIDKTAKIGFSFIYVEKLKMGANSKIQHFNMIRNLELLDVGYNSTIGNFNTANAIPLGSKRHFSKEENRCQALIIGDHSGVVKDNYFDCNNKIIIGRYTIVAGFGSAFFTHSINVENSRQETKEINIGDYCMIGAKSVVTRGAILPDFSILAANSTLHKPFTDTHTLYSGVPAKAAKKIDEGAKYFHRTDRFVE